MVAFFQRPARDGNSDVETKPVCSGLLHHPVGRHCCLYGGVGGGGGLEIQNEREREMRERKRERGREREK